MIVSSYSHCRPSSDGHYYVPRVLPTLMPKRRWSCVPSGCHVRNVAVTAAPTVTHTSVAVAEQASSARLEILYVRKECTLARNNM